MSNTASKYHALTDAELRIVQRVFEDNPEVTARVEAELALRERLRYEAMPRTWTALATDVKAERAISESSEIKGDEVIRISGKIGLNSSTEIVLTEFDARSLRDQLHHLVKKISI